MRSRSAPARIAVALAVALLARRRVQRRRRGEGHAVEHHGHVRRRRGERDRDGAADERRHEPDAGVEPAGAGVQAAAPIATAKIAPLTQPAAAYSWSAFVTATASTFGCGGTTSRGTTATCTNDAGGAGQVTIRAT